MKKIFGLSSALLILSGILFYSNFAQAQNVTNQPPYFDQFTVQDVWFDSAIAVNVNFQTPSAYTGSDKMTPVNVSCDHTSGTTFQPGRTVITCTAINNGKTAETYFKVWVRAGNTPIITLTYSTSGSTDSQGGLETTETSSGAGVTVNYSYDLNLKDYSGNNSLKAESISCSPASGSIFHAGINPITCTAYKSAAQSGPQIIIMEQAGVITVHGSEASNSGSTNNGGSGSNNTFSNIIYSRGGGEGGSIPSYKVTNNACPNQSFTIMPSGQINCVAIAQINLNKNKVLTDTTGLSGFQFTLGLKIGAGLTNKLTATEVMNLQKFLNLYGFTIATTGPGSKGNETKYFGPATKKALVKFQIAHPPLKPDGIFGPKTRAIMNAFIKNLVNKTA